MGEGVNLHESADVAWEQYRSLAIRLSCDPHLLTDRRHMEAMARAERDWKRAFLASEEFGFFELDDAPFVRVHQPVQQRVVERARGGPCMQVHGRCCDPAHRGIAARLH